METRTVSESLNDVLENIRNITAQELFLTKASLENWNQQISTKPRPSDEKIWSSFLEALPPQIRKTFESIRLLDEELRESALHDKKQERIKEGKSEEGAVIGVDEVTTKWANVLMQSGRDIKLNENDFDQVFCKFKYLCGEILAPYNTIEGAVGEQIVNVGRFSGYFNAAFNVNKLFKTTPPEVSGRIEEIAKEKNEIERTIKATYPEESQKDKQNEINLKIYTDTKKLNAEQKRLEGIMEKPIEDGIKRIAEQVEAANPKTVLQNFVIDARNRKLIPPLGDRKTAFNDIEAYLRSNEFNKDQAYHLLQRLQGIADDKIRGKKLFDLGANELSDLCKSAIFEIAPEKVATKTSGFMFFQQQKHAPKEPEKVQPSHSANIKKQ